jgi:AraC-like DNA-binding protein
MNLVADTSLVSPEERFDYWAEASPRALLHPLSLQRSTHEPFSGRIAAHQLGPVNVFRVWGGASTAILRSARISSCDPECFSVAVAFHGRHRVAQEDRSAIVTPGDMVTLQTSRPYATRFETPYDLALFTFPYVLLRPHTDRICAQTAQRVTAAQGVGRVVATFLRGLAEELNAGRVSEDDTDLGESVIDLVRGLFASPNAVPPCVTGYAQRKKLLHQVRSYIDANLPDPSLSPEWIARENFISVRYLYKLLDGEGGVCALIRSKRLERCRRDLSDPALRGDSITSIARRWGLSDAGYFSRLFRESYGVSPTEFRRDIGSAGELSG